LPRIVAVDLQPMAPVEGVTQLQGDITARATVDAVLAHFSGCQADLVVCDGAPDVTGMHDLDEFVQGQLILSALTVVAHALRPGGCFVAKIFRGKDTTLLYSQLKLFFPDVVCAKPRSSRNASIEAFAVCRNFTPPRGFDPAALSELLGAVAVASEEREAQAPPRRELSDDEEALAESRFAATVLMPFLACGDLSGYDADASYPLPPHYTSLPPVAPPLAPAYLTAHARAQALAHGGRTGAS
jgi:tRNA (cytidine32/guanosine34-2'-O)-methyltransferase